MPLKRFLTPSRLLVTLTLVPLTFAPLAQAPLGRHMTIVDPLGIGRLVGKALFECLRLLGHSQRHRHDEGAAQSQYFAH